MTAQSQCWYIRGEGNQPAGPYAAEQLVEALRAGRVEPNTVCWHEGMPQWLPLSQVQPFAAAIRRSPARAHEQPKPPLPSSQGVPPQIPSRLLRPRVLVPLIGVSLGGILVVALAIVALLGSGGGLSNRDKPSGYTANREAAALARIVADYAKRLKEAHNAAQTDVQRRDAVAAAVEELKAAVGKCGTVTFAGRVAEIIQEGPRYGGSFRWENRERWGISMALPKEFEALVRDGACSFGSKVWVELPKEDALSIQKGDPIAIRGPVSYTEGSTLLATDCVDMQVWPNSEHSGVKGFGLGNLGSPHTIAVPVSGSVTCSVGRFKSLPVHTYLGQ